jgi:hypothetical protein
MPKLLFFYNLLISTIIAVTGLASAQTLNQAVFALLFVPLILYFLKQLKGRSSPVGLVLRAQQLLPTTYLPPPEMTAPAQATRGELAEAIEGQELSPLEVKDINRRLFLKLIGTAGLTTFFFALFTKSSHAAFFGSVPGPGTVSLKDTAGNKIDPAEKQPTDGYEVCQMDDSAIPSYYGFVDKNSNWYIAREGNGGEFRYTAGTYPLTNFTTAWSTRSSQSYALFDQAFS